MIFVALLVSASFYCARTYHRFFKSESVSLLELTEVQFEIIYWVAIFESSIKNIVEKVPSNAALKG